MMVSMRWDVRRVGFLLIMLSLVLNAGCRAMPSSTDRGEGAGPHLEKAEQVRFPGWMKAVAFFQGERSLVVGGCQMPSSTNGTGSSADACDHGLVQVWNLGATRPVAAIELPGTVTALAVSSDGNMWVAGDAAGRLISSKSAGRVSLKSYHQKGEITALAFSPDGKWVASGSLDRSFPLGFLDMETGGVVRVKARFDPVSTLAFSPDGKNLVVGMMTGEVVVWTFGENSTPLPVLSKKTDGAVTGVAFSPDGQLLAYGRQDGHIGILDWSRERVLVEFQGASAVKTLAFSPDGRYLAYGQENGKVVLVESKEMRQVWSKRYLLSITDLAYSSDGTRMAVATHRIVDVFRLDAASTGHAAQGGSWVSDKNEGRERSLGQRGEKSR
ncbi:MAG: WD40 repeat domain-containing protein [Nitrospirae bacterium]|nr:MAG: WD40 repeat domain-containing protein [Nitrospirota bacterium]